MAKMLKAGTVLVNDLIAPTADPRVAVRRARSQRLWRDARRVKDCWR